MKISIVNIEASTDDIKASKRISDLLLEAVSNVLDDFSGMRFSANNLEDESDEGDLEDDEN